MSAITLETTPRSQVQAAITGLSRLFFVDHLRAVLVILVVLHHIAVTYSASSPFYYVEPSFADAPAFKALLVFILANQAWFMGAFFLLAGYFTPGSFDRKGATAFLKERLIRLGIPLVLFIFLLNPLASLGVYLMPAEITGITSPPTWEAYPKLIGLGPLWFVALLLVFSFAYAGWRGLTQNRPAAPVSSRAQPGYLVIAGFVVGLALLNYLFRMIVPLGQSVSLFVDFLAFPTLAYLPQYLSFFILGVVAYRRDWFRSLTMSTGLAGLAAAALASVLLFPLAFSGQFLSLELGPALNNAMGNGHWQSAVYALWDSIFAVGLCLGLIPLFRRFFNGQSRLGTFLAQQSYTVYIIHALVIVFVAYALRGVALASLLKFAVAAIVILPVCFAIAYLIRKLPLAARVL